MPNTVPVIDSLDLAMRVESRGAAVGLIDVFAIGAVSKSLAGEELSTAIMTASEKLRMFSDDGHCVSNAALMGSALRISAQSGCVISQHSQDPLLAGGGQVNAGEAAVRLGLTEWPNSAESSIVARDVELAAATGGRLHVAHVSTAETVDVIRWAKNRGVQVTAEVTPHHLLLDDSHTFGFDTRFKVNPPLRSNEDRAALVSGLLDGTIDAVATDHAPHSRDAKDAEWPAAAFGMTGLQQALGVVQRVLIEQAGAGWELIERVMSHNPARIVKLSDRGILALGKRADIVLIDPKRTKRVELADNLSRGQNSPYLGLTLPDPVVHVYRGERQLVMDGALVD
jgi:dihydroorotase